MDVLVPSYHEVWRMGDGLVYSAYHIIALSRRHRLTLIRQRLERTSTSEEHPAIGSLYSVFKVTFGICGGVGQGEDDGFVVEFGHAAQDVCIEGAADGRKTHQDGGLDVLNHFGEGLELLALVVVAGEVGFVGGELVATVVCHETLGWRINESGEVRGGRKYTFESTSQNRLRASSSLRPSFTKNSTICLATPTPALPAPRKTARWSFGAIPVVLTALMKPPRMTAPVPWISSLKHVYTS